MAKVINKWTEKEHFGIRKSDGAYISITPPSWDCKWYWSFGYLGNRNEHYHLSSYAEGRNINMHDALLQDYDLESRFKDNLWEFCELSKTIYTLKETAEVLGRGGSYYSGNPCKNIIINKEEVSRINNVILPSLFNAIAYLIPKDDILHKIRKELNG